MSSTSFQHPFLFNKAIPRIVGENLPGRYCAKLQQWVVPYGDQELPIIDTGGSAAMVATKTLNNTEKDDASKQILMVQTKTEAQLESEDKSTMTELMVQTKTRVHNEADDTGFTSDVGWL